MGLLRRLRDRPPGGDDYRHVTSEAVAREQVEARVLEPFLLQPVELGGQDTAANTAYVPRGRLEQTRQAFLRRAASEMPQGFAYDAIPGWHETCLVPCIITFVATAENGQRLESRIDIWNPGRR